MDAYSISCTSPSQRSSSKIYQDLKSARLRCLIDLNQDQLLKALGTMGTLGKRRHRDPTRKPHIGVIGAGLAGLRCVDILLQYGFRVTVLEGRDHVGGRLHQETLPNGHLVDTGPNWIHGTEDNPMFELARKTKTTIGSWDTKPYMFDQFGNLLSLEEGELYSDIMWDIVQDAFKHSELNCAKIDPNESLWDYFQREVVERIPESERDYQKKRESVLHVAELWGAFVGSPITMQSLKFFWLEECIEGANLFCAGTYKKVLEAIAKPALEGADVRFRKTAEKISYRVESTDTIRVLVSGGEIFEFDEVVLTAPLGWLKRHLDAFEPPLPARLCNAIESMGYGCLEKVYISFKTAFWLDPDAEGRLMQGFCQWLSPSYASDTNPKRWNQEVVELARLTPTTSHATLLFYLYGEQSKFVTEAVSGAKSREEKEKFIYGFFEPYYSRLPGWKPTDECKPTGCLTTDWLHDDLAGCGSYTNFPVGTERPDQDIRVMRKGLPDSGLWLAGEHTAPFVGVGTATGAYWSGEMVGRWIAEDYGRTRRRTVRPGFGNT